MSEQSEKLAVNIRKALGNHNDNNEAVTILVAQVRQQLDQAMADVARLRDALTWSLGKLSFVAPLAGGKYNYIRAFEKASTALQETPADAFIKLKQAEAIEVMCGQWMSEAADLPMQHECRSKGSSTYNWQTHYAKAGKAYAKRLRGEVNDE